MNMCTLDDAEKEEQRAQHRARVALVNKQLRERYAKEEAEATQRAADEEEYARMENEGGPSND